jgi:hypothetical protein
VEGTGRLKRTVAEFRPLTRRLRTVGPHRRDGESGGAPTAEAFPRTGWGRRPVHPLLAGKFLVPWGPVHRPCTCSPPALRAPSPVGRERVGVRPVHEKWPDASEEEPTVETSVTPRPRPERPPRTASAEDPVTHSSSKCREAVPNPDISYWDRWHGDCPCRAATRRSGTWSLHGRLRVSPLAVPS